MAVVIHRCLIYALVDPRNGNVRYIGKSTTGLWRPKTHQMPKTLEKDSNGHKANWIRQLKGRGLSYQIVVLEEDLDKADLGSAEQEWIAWGRWQGWPLVNMTDGGDGQPGLRHSEEAKRKIAEKAALYRHSEESRAKIGTAHRGKKVSPETGARISAAKKGRRTPLEERRALSRSHGGRAFVDQFGRRYETTVEASEALGIARPMIGRVLHGQAKHTHGLVFRYVE